MKAVIVFLLFCGVVSAEFSANTDRCPGDIVARADKPLPTEMRNDSSTATSSSSSSGTSSSDDPIVGPNYVDPTSSRDELFD